ncbi:hypothetical protein DFH06DRAFT_1055103 [Mycena polygramma]|nr:hypothetical protein DFH06DRAFT_1055103 [Mycena polygramma]
MPPPVTPRVHIPTYIPLATADSRNSSIWSIYVAEAETYNKALVASWSDNVTGILIFSGLFSATVTAFIIEGYKTLLEDSGQTTARLLGQISAQLGEISRGNNSSFSLPPSPPFAPSSSAVVCNIFWFTSLGLSLSCALIATLVGQWAQNFLHCVGIHSPPVVGARIMSFLYYGVRRFNMHAVVALIPLLMHMSLFFFFAGLVAFLIPVNLTVVVVCSAIPLVFTAIYVTLSLLPLRYLDCPYRTPLSDALWSLSRWYRRIIKLETTDSARPRRQTIVDAMIRAATADTEERASRDCRALTWTVKCLVDDNQLQEFIRCIPSLLQESRNVAHRYGNHIMDLIANPDIQLYVRIEGMLRTASAGILAAQADDETIRDPFSERRQICYRAMWAIAKLEPTFAAVTDAQLVAGANSQGEFGRFLLPLVTVTQNRAFSALDMEMKWVLNYLRTCGPLLVASANIGDLQCVFDCVAKMERSNVGLSLDQQAFGDILKDRHPNFRASPAWIDHTAAFIQRFRTDSPYLMLFRYLVSASAHSNGTYEHEYTYNSFQLQSGPLSPTVHAALQRSLATVRRVRGNSPFILSLMQQLNAFVTVGEQRMRVPSRLVR